MFLSFRVLHKDPTAVTKMWHDKLNSLQEDMDILAKRQSQIDRENMLADQEESLSERKTELENYEKEVNICIIRARFNVSLFPLLPLQQHNIRTQSERTSSYSKLVQSQ